MEPKKTPRKALIFGVSGQDGAYLAEFLLGKGYRVWGTSRNAVPGAQENLRRLGILERVTLLAAKMTDPASVRACLEAAEPDEIYNLAGQTSVSMSFEMPVETIESIAHSTLNLLEAMRGTKARLFHAGSAECFGNAGKVRLNEESAFRPKSPYGAAKAAAHWQVVSYRDCFGMYACNGILFNHESPLRPQKFVTQKVIAAVGAIARGSREKLRLGAIDVWRDWGWAPEYVEAMWRMLQQESPDDFLIATGESHSLREFVESAFASIGKHSAEFMEQDSHLLRPSEIQYSYADVLKIERKLGWKATKKMADVVRLMLEADDAAHSTDAGTMPTR